MSNVPATGYDSETETFFYSWSPNFLAVKDPETLTYSGNVIGNMSKGDRIKIVTDVGAAKKEEILEESAQFIEEIEESSKKLLDILALSDNTMGEIISYFGNGS